MIKEEINEEIAKSRYADMDWEIYTGIEEEDTDPCNKEECKILLSDGKFKTDQQDFGCWGYDDVIAWAYL